MAFKSIGGTHPKGRPGIPPNCAGSRTAACLIFNNPNIQTENAPGLPFHPELPDVLGFKRPHPGMDAGPLGFGPGAGGSIFGSFNIPGIDEGGPLPWDFSTPSQGFSTPQATQELIAPVTQDSSETSWEDSIVSVASTLAPLLF